MFLLLRKLYFSKDPEGFQYFSGRGWGGVQKLIPTETHINFDFPGGGAGSIPPPSGSAHENDSDTCCMLLNDNK